MILPPMLDFLVGVFTHDDRRVDHRANRYGDTVQRHDVRVDPLETHDNERRYNAQGQAKDTDKRREEVPDEQRHSNITTVHSIKQLMVYIHHIPVETLKKSKERDA